MSSATLHILPENGSWSVKFDRAECASSVHPSRTLAVATAFAMVEDREGAILIIHGPDGIGKTSLTVQVLDPPAEVLQTAALDESLDVPNDDHPVQAQTILPRVDALLRLKRRPTPARLDLDADPAELY